MKKLILMISMFVSTTVFAGEASDFHNLGFSKDGKNYAFMQVAVLDALGAYWVSIDVIDVDNNKLIKRARANEEDLDIPYEEIGQEKNRDLLIAKVKKMAELNKFGIIENSGEVLVSRPNTDLGEYKTTDFSTFYWPEGGATGALDYYSLKIKEHQISQSVEEYCSWYNPMLLELTISYDGQEQVLQKDQRLPKSRCGSNYEIRYVVHYKGKLAVGVRYQEPGFEGPSESFIAVTGNLENLNQ